jgi:F1F0 ATPase subunit 2
VPWFLGSLLLRTGIVLTGFYFVSGGHWDRLLTCLLGFIIARIIVTRFTGPSFARPDTPVNEEGHAPESR